MKKLFTLIAAALMTIGASAAEQLTPTAFPLGEKIELNGVNWEGKYQWIGDADWSQYDYLWIKYENCSGPINFGIVYNEWLKKESWGDSFETQQSAITEGEGGVFGLKIDKTSTYTKGDAETGGKFIGDVYAKHIRQYQIQAAGAVANITILEVWLGTEAEYNSAKEGNTPEGPKSKDLTLADLSSGWGGSTYDAATKTVTIGDDWSGKGWWLDKTDYSAFDQLVIKFDPATEANGNIVIEYNDGVASTKYEFAAGTTTAIIDLDATGKASVKQIYIQGPAASKYVLSAAYVATKEYVAENETTGGETPATPTTLIDYPTKEAKAENGITLGSEVSVGTFKIHTNTDAVSGFKFGGGYTADGVIKAATTAVLSVDGGFKKGDKIQIAGAFNNSSDSKQAGVQIFTGAAGESATVLWTSELFINGRLVADDPAVQEYTLEADAATLNLGRSNGLSSPTATWVTLLKVVRETATGIQEIPVKVINNGAIYNLAGQKVNESYKGIVIKNGKKFIQK
jgi:hypothetical protein